jgi:hypothetical protein
MRQPLRRALRAQNVFEIMIDCAQRRGILPQRYVDLWLLLGPSRVGLKQMANASRQNPMTGRVLELGTSTPWAPRCHCLCFGICDTVVVEAQVLAGQIAF